MQMGVRTGFDAVVLGRADAMARAVADAGGRVAATLPLAQAGEAAALAGRPVLAIEAEGADPAMLDAALAAVAAIVTERGLSVVVAFDQNQLDAVAAVLLGERVHLLADATPADRVTQLVLAAHEGRAPPPGVRETDSEQLSRLNGELARLVDLLAVLTRQDARDAVADRSRGFGAGSADAAAIVVDPAEVRRVIRARRLREKAFATGLFEDPAWDILLDLYAASLEGAEVSVSSLCIAAAVAPTTALRWIGRMTAAGLLDRARDPADRRRALMSLSGAALTGMRSYAAMLRAQGLPFV